MSWLDEERHHHLTKGLVGNQYAELYQRSGSFKYAIDTLTQLLPSMVDGLALRSVKQDETHRRQVEAMRLMKPTTIDMDEIRRTFNLPTEEEE